MILDITHPPCDGASYTCHDWPEYGVTDCCPWCESYHPEYMKAEEERSRAIQAKRREREKNEQSSTKLSD